MRSTQKLFTSLLCCVALHAHACAAAAQTAAEKGATAGDVDDPLLTPVSAPARRLTRWSEIATMLRARSVDLASANAAVRRAEADRRGAVAPLFGELQAQGQGTQNLLIKETAQASSPTARVGGLGATLSVPLVAPRTWQEAKTAAIGLDLATELLGDQRRVVMERAASAVVAVFAAERVAEINRVGLRAALERTALSKRRHTLGGGTALDVVRAEQDLETARALVVTGDEALRQARESLGLALGWPEQVGVAPDFRLDDAVRDASRECRVMPLEKRADIVAAETRIRQAEQVTREARWALAPTVGAQSQLAYTTEDSPFQYPTQWNVQAVVSWSLWDGGARYAQMSRGHALRDQAAAGLEGARRDLMIAITRADRAVKVASDSRDIASRARDAALEQERLTRLAFTTGNGTSLELVTAAAQLRNQEITLALRDYDLVRARLLSLFVRARCDY